MKAKVISGKGTALRRCWLGALVCLACLAVRASAGGLSLAQAYLANEDYPNADRVLNQFLAASFNSPASRGDCVSALELLCRSYYRQGRYEDTLDLIEKNADLCAEDGQRFLFLQARALVGLGKAEEAIARLTPEQLLASKTNDVATLNLMRVAADAYASLGSSEDGQKAMALLDRFLAGAVSVSKVPTNSAVLLRAQLLSRCGRADEASQQLKALAENIGGAEKNRHNAQIGAEALCALTGLSVTNTQEAVGYAGKIEALFLHDGKIRYQKDLSGYLIKCADLLVARKETVPYGAALLARGVELAQDIETVSSAQLKLAQAWDAAGSNEYAVAEYKKFLERCTATQEESAVALEGRGRALYALENYDEAATSFTKAALSSTNAAFSVKCFIAAADAYYAAEKYEQALAGYSKFTDAEHSPTASPHCRLMAGDCCERLGKIDDAEMFFKELVEDTEDGLIAEQALYRLAALYERTGKNKAATLEYGKLIAATTNDELRCTALLGRGRCHYRNKALDKAVADFRQVVAGGYTTSEMAALYLVYSLYGSGHDNEAVAQAESFIAKNPESEVASSVFFWLAQYYYNGEQALKAAEQFIQFADRWPGDARAPRALLWAVKVFVGQSEYTRALETIAAIGQRYSESDVIEEARYIQAKALCSLSRFEDAVITLNDVLSRYPNGEFTTRALVLKGDALFTLAGSSETSAGITNSAVAYATALDRTDATPDIKLECYYKTGRCLEKTGDLEAALDTYYAKVFVPYTELLKTGAVTQNGQSFYTKAVFAAAAIYEQKRQIDSAVLLLREYAKANLPDRKRAEDEINRLENQRDTL